MGSLAEIAGRTLAGCTVLSRALRDPRTPWTARIVGGVTLLYALSPIDLIPDFIPVLGYLDDLVIVPLGLWLAIRLIPRDVWAECEAEVARRGPPTRLKDWRGAMLVVAIWLGLVAIGVAWLWPFVRD